MYIYAGKENNGSGISPKSQKFAYISYAYAGYSTKRCRVYFLATETCVIMEGVKVLGRGMRKEIKQMEQLHIGQVTASAQIVQEIEETEDFQVFCMSCVRRHRSGDWGDVPKEHWIRNNQSRRKGGAIVSEYAIPEIFGIGYADRIIVTTDEERIETKIQFPDD